MAKDKVAQFNFRDGVHPVRIGDKVFQKAGERRGHDYELVVTAIGRLLITVNYKVDGSSYGASQYYIETGRIKSDYSQGGSLYSSKAAYDKWCIDYETRDKLCAMMRGHYSPPDWLTYDKACRILKILEET